MRIAYVSKVLEETSQLGQQHRRRSVVEKLVSAGCTVELIELKTSNRLPESFWRYSPTLRREITRKLSRSTSDCIWVEGWSLGHATCLAVDAEIGVVDVCDSYVQLTSSSAFAVTPVVVAIKLWMFGRALKAFRRRQWLKTYISREDRDIDGARFGFDLTAVISNRLAPKQPVRLDPNGPFLLVADWTYRPNLELLERALVWAAEPAQRRDRVRLRIVGPGLDGERVNARHCDYWGFISDLTDAYSGVCMSLADLGGAGVKNKVLEAAAFGVPVLVNETSARGIAKLPPGSKRVASGEWPCSKSLRRDVVAGQSVPLDVSDEGGDMRLILTLLGTEHQ